jgi:hypothetical protein
MIRRLKISKKIQSRSSTPTIATTTTPIATTTTQIADTTPKSVTTTRSTLQDMPNQRPGTDASAAAVDADHLAAAVDVKKYVRGAPTPMKVSIS